MAQAGLAVALVAMLVSAVGVGLAWRAAREAERHGRMPVLVAQHARDAVGVLNIGQGPALNVVIAQGGGSLTSTDVLALDVAALRAVDAWTGHRHLDPLPAGQERWYAWDWGEPLVGLTYTDALGHRYSALSGAHGSRVVDGLRLPHPAMSRLLYPPAVDPPRG